MLKREDVKVGRLYLLNGERVTVYMIHKPGSGESVTLRDELPLGCENPYDFIRRTTMQMRKFQRAALAVFPEPTFERRTEMQMIDGFPRRSRLDLHTPAETAIRAALNAVEAAGAHPLLTDAVNLLIEAGNKVADFVELDVGRPVKPHRSGGGHWVGKAQ